MHLLRYASWVYVGPTELQVPVYMIHLYCHTNKRKTKAYQLPQKSLKRYKTLQIAWGFPTARESLLKMHWVTLQQAGLQHLCRRHHLVAILKVSREKNELTPGFERQIIKNLNLLSLFPMSLARRAFLTDLPGKQLLGLPLATHPTPGTLTVSHTHWADKSAPQVTLSFNLLALAFHEWALQIWVMLWIQGSDHNCEPSKQLLWPTWFFFVPPMHALPYSTGKRTV